MVKQEHSKKEEKEKFNIISIFLSKFIFRDNFDALKKSGFKDSFIADPHINEIIKLEDNQKFLFLLFKNNKLKIEEIKKIVKALAIINIDIVFSYELINNYLMIVIDFPEKFIKDYNLIVDGKYSKLSDEFKNGFPVTKDVYNSSNVRIGKEYSIYYHIFNKTEWIKNFWCERLKLIELDDNLELWIRPEKEEIIFDINKILK